MITVSNQRADVTAVIGVRRKYEHVQLGRTYILFHKPVKGKLSNAMKMILPIDGQFPSCYDHFTKVDVDI